MSGMSGFGVVCLYSENRAKAPAGGKGRRGMAGQGKSGEKKTMRDILSAFLRMPAPPKRKKLWLSGLRLSARLTRTASESCFLFYALRTGFRCAAADTDPPCAKAHARRISQTQKAPAFQPGPCLRGKAPLSVLYARFGVLLAACIACGRGRRAFARLCRTAAFRSALPNKKCPIPTCWPCPSILPAPRLPVHLARTMASPAHAGCMPVRRPK